MTTEPMMDINQLRDLLRAAVSQTKELAELLGVSYDPKYQTVSAGLAECNVRIKLLQEELERLRTENEREECSPTWTAGYNKGVADAVEKQRRLRREASERIRPRGFPSDYEIEETGEGLRSPEPHIVLSEDCSGCAALRTELAAERAKVWRLEAECKEALSLLYRHIGGPNPATLVPAVRLVINSEQETMLECIKLTAAKTRLTRALSFIIETDANWPISAGDYETLAERCVSIARAALSEGAEKEDNK